MVAGEDVAVGRRQRGENVGGGQQVRHRVDAEHGGEQRGHRRQRPDLMGHGVGDALLLEAAGERVGEVAGQPGDHQREEHADRERRAGVLEGRAHPRRGAALGRRDAAHDRGGVGCGEHAHADAVDEEEQRERPVGEVDGQQQQPDEARAEHEHPGGGEPARAEAVGQVAGDRARDQEGDRERQQVDARPQRRLDVVVAVQRQPDALQPDDEHELQSAAGDGGDEPGRAAGGEGADAEQAELEHRLGHPALDGDEGHEQQDPADEAARTHGLVQPIVWPP